MIGQRESVSGAHFAFTDRWGGVSAAPYEELNLGGAVGDDPGAVTSANRELAAKSLGIDPARVVWMHQVHGNDVAVVDGPWGSTAEIPPVDAVVPPGGASPSPSCAGTRARPGRVLQPELRRTTGKSGTKRSPHSR
ncbi:hypothetical protein SGLAM104S_07427 [Streptomyces glaucescens]